LAEITIDFGTVSAHADIFGDNFYTY
jgi:hypothetical protein